jgi:hypothetical protein
VIESQSILLNVVDLTAGIRHVMAVLVALPQGFPDGILRLPIMLTQHRLNRLRCFEQMVVRNRQENVVSDVGADVVVDRFKDAVVPIDGGQCTLEEIPIFAAIPGHFFIGVVQEGHQIKPNDKAPIGNEVVGEEGAKAKLRNHNYQERNHGQTAGSAGQRHVPFRGTEDGAIGGEVGSSFARRSGEQIDRIGKQEQIEPSKLCRCIHRLIVALAQRVPAFVVFEAAGILVVGAVADAPAVEGNQNCRVANMADQIVEPTRSGKGAVTAVMADDKQGPKHRALRKPIDREKPPGIDRRSRKDETGDDAPVQKKVRHRSPDRGFEAMLGDCVLDVVDGERQAFTIQNAGIGSFNKTRRHADS